MERLWTATCQNGLMSSRVTGWNATQRFRVRCGTCHLGWRTLLKCNKTNHACLPACLRQDMPSMRLLARGLFGYVYVFYARERLLHGW